jgi:hypothetical protein
MTPLRWKMIDDMQAAGLVAETQTVYLRAVAALAAYYRRAPDQLSEAEVRAYLLHLRDHRGVAHGTFHTQHGGMQFLFTQTLGREWSLFSKKEFALPSANVCPTSSPTPRLVRLLAA